MLPLSTDTGYIEKNLASPSRIIITSGHGGFLALDETQYPVRHHGCRDETTEETCRYEIDCTPQTETL